MVVVEVIPKPMTGIPELASLVNWPGLTRATVAPGVLRANTRSIGGDSTRRRARATRKTAPLALGNGILRETKTSLTNILFYVKPRGRDDSDFVVL